jgi:hypothetical protein
MERLHDDLLTVRLETVLDEGCAHVSRRELRRWYGKKLAARTFRDIEQRWQEVSEGTEGPLYRIQGAAGYYLLAGDRMGLISDEVGEE